MRWIRWSPMFCEHSGHRLDCPTAENWRGAHDARRKRALTRPDHEAFEAKLVRTGRNEGTVDDGLQADGTLFFFLCDFFMFSIRRDGLEFNGHRQRRRLCHAQGLVAFREIEGESE